MRSPPPTAFRHALHHRFGDRGDGLLGHLRAVYLGQVSRYLPVCGALRGQRQHHPIHAGQPALPLLHELRLKGASRVPGHLHLDRADVGQHGLRTGAVAGVAAVPACRVVLVIADVISDLTLQGGLQHPLGQLLQQPVLSRYCVGAWPSACRGVVGWGVLGQGHCTKRISPVRRSRV